MLRGVSSLLGLFFVTAGVFAVASLSKTTPVLLAAPPRPPRTSVGSRCLAMNTLAYHARPSVN